MESQWPEPEVLAFWLSSSASVLHRTISLILGCIVHMYAYVSTCHVDDTVYLPRQLPSGRSSLSLVASPRATFARVNQKGRERGSLNFSLSPAIFYSLYLLLFLSTCLCLSVLACLPVKLASRDSQDRAALDLIGIDEPRRRERVALGQYRVSRGEWVTRTGGGIEKNSFVWKFVLGKIKIENSLNAWLALLIHFPLYTLKLKILKVNLLEFSFISVTEIAIPCQIKYSS